MSSTPVADDAAGYLQLCRDQVLSCVEGISEYDARRPRTPTGTNLLGIVKHLVGIEAGYLGLCLGRPFPVELPWITNPDAGPNDDMWATPDESSQWLLGLYREAAQHADRNLAELGDTAPATVPWWPEDRRATHAAALRLRVLKDTAMHAGQMQILRELVAGTAGSDRDAIGDARWWRDHHARVERAARAAAPGTVGRSCSGAGN